HRAHGERGVGDTAHRIVPGARLASARVAPAAAAQCDEVGVAERRRRVSVRAAAIPASGAHEQALPAPAWVSEAVLRACAEHDWAAALPPHAHGWPWRAGRRVKRALDIVLSALGLVLLAPLFALLALAIRLGSRGPVLYEWRVLGERGRPFVGYKFRTMVMDADAR